MSPRFAIRGSQLLLQLDARPLAQQVIPHRDHLQLTTILADRIVMTSLAIVHVAEPRMRADDDQAGGTGHRLILQPDGVA